MTSLALSIEQSTVTDDSPVTDYARRRPLMARGALRRVRYLPSGAELQVQPGQVVRAGDVIAYRTSAGQSVVLNLARALGVNAGDAGSIRQYVVVEAGQAIAEGDVLAERRTLGGFQRRTVRAPLTGRVEYVSPESGNVYISPGRVTRAVHAHLAGTVVAVTDGSVAIEGEGMVLRGRAGAGPAVAGPLAVAAAPDALPRACEGAIVACAFAVDEGIVQRLIDTGAIAIVAGIEEDAIERLGWDSAFWPELRTEQVAVPPITILALAFSTAPPIGVWEVLRAASGRPASVLGGERGCDPELLVELGEAAPSLYALPSSSEADVRLAPGQRVRVIAGRGHGLVGEIISISPSPYRLRSEVAVDVADVAFPYDVRLRVPVLHLQAFP